MNAHLSPMRVVVLVATQPVLEGGVVGNVDHEDGKGIFVAALDELLHARLFVSRATFSSLSSLVCRRSTAGWSSSSKRMVLPYGSEPNGQETQAQLKPVTCGSYTGSATGSDHSLGAPVICKVLSNVHDHVGQIKEPGVLMKLSQDCLVMHHVDSGV
eukprot:4679539-Pleurochrysis_carterae.AAC.1